MLIIIIEIAFVEFDFLIPLLLTIFFSKIIKNGFPDLIKELIFYFKILSLTSNSAFVKKKKLTKNDNCDNMHH